MAIKFHIPKAQHIPRPVIQKSVNKYGKLDSQNPGDSNFRYCNRFHLAKDNNNNLQERQLCVQDSIFVSLYKRSYLHV